MRIETSKIDLWVGEGTGRTMADVTLNGKSVLASGWHPTPEGALVALMSQLRERADRIASTARTKLTDEEELLWAWACKLGIR